MEEELSHGWRQSGRFSGNYNDYSVSGFKYVSPIGDVAWCTTSWPNLRSIIHNFWVSTEKFYRFGTHPAQSILARQPIDVIDEVVEVDRDEREAILLAIKDWESLHPLGTDWRNYNPSDETTHPEDAREIELRFGSGRTVRAFYNSGFLGSVGYANLISEEESNSKICWRYSKNS
jgi:hypothetical protein